MRYSRACLWHVLREKKAFWDTQSYYHRPRENQQYLDEFLAFLCVPCQKSAARNLPCRYCRKNIKINCIFHDFVLLILVMPFSAEKIRNQIRLSVFDNLLSVREKVAKVPLNVRFVEVHINQTGHWPRSWWNPFTHLKWRQEMCWR